MSTVAQLLTQKAAIEKQIADAQREERSAAIAQVKALMAQHGLSTADLAGRAGPACPPSTATQLPAKPGAVVVCNRSGCGPHSRAASRWPTSRSDCPHRALVNQGPVTQEPACARRVRTRTHR
jgi:hypothetical protein